MLSSRVKVPESTLHSAINPASTEVNGRVQH